MCSDADTKLQSVFCRITHVTSARYIGILSVELGTILIFRALITNKLIRLFVGYGVGIICVLRSRSSVYITVRGVSCCRCFRFRFCSRFGAVSYRYSQTGMTMTNRNNTRCCNRQISVLSDAGFCVTKSE